MYGWKAREEEERERITCACGHRYTPRTEGYCRACRRLPNPEPPRTRTIDDDMYDDEMWHGLSWEPEDS